MSTIQSNKFTITVNKPIVDWSEEIKEVGEMAAIENEEEITIEPLAPAHEAHNPP